MYQLHKKLLQVTKDTSCFETKRDYVSLSNIIKPVEELIFDYQNGYNVNDEIQLKCRMGYWMERGLKERLRYITGITESEEIVVPESNGLIKGHPDFFYTGYPGDCKSFLLDEFLPDERKVPKKIYWQMNAYMLYSEQITSVIICESRESGMLKTIEVRKNIYICNQINEKVKEIIKILSSKKAA